MSKFSWGKTACVLSLVCATTAIDLSAQTLTVLHTFDNTDGATSYAELVQGADGNFYGTTEWGGANNSGTVFKITPSGTLTTLYNFCSHAHCVDGSVPIAGLVQGTDGNFYGTTLRGGANATGCLPGGCGTAFRITPSGTLTTLYSFCSQTGCADGDEPYAALVQATDGNLYGTTALAGAGGCGTLFKITLSGSLTTFHTLDQTEGCAPVALVQALDGNFYGTTYSGGANNFGGTVFKITPSGSLTVLYSFCSQSGCSDGQAPTGLIQVTDGNFYGTTSEGGNSTDCFYYDSCGTVFKIAPSGTFTTLHSFDNTDGGNPFAGLVQATDGNLYGSTWGGGTSSYGTLFKITTRGVLTTLYNFCFSGCTSGDSPYAGLIQATDGNLYGTTSGGGDNGANAGTVFSLSVGLGPFVETLPTLGPVGRPVRILGTNLTGATSVTFNGTAAVFTVVSSSLIKTSVPVGATTGTVQVVTPSGTLSSNVPFRVRP